jgi:lysophospholipase L1-like esterase
MFKKAVIMLSGALIVIVSAASCGNGSLADGQSGSSIVCFGDSLTEGYGASIPGVVDKTKSYPAYLQNAVTIPVHNAGISGDTTAQGLARLSRDVLSKNPSIVVVEFGANDLFNLVTVNTTQNNLAAILSALNNGRRKIYLAKFYTEAVAQALFTANGIPAPMQTALIAQYDSMFSTLAQTHNATLINDIWSGVWGVKMSDTIHPNAQGYETMSALVLNAMRPHLQANNLLK